MDGDETRELHRIISASVRDMLDAYRIQATAGPVTDKALEEISTLETARRRLIPEVEGLKRLQNTSGDEIARARRQGQDTASVQEANRARAQQIKQLGFQLDSVEPAGRPAPILRRGRPWTAR